MKKAFIDADYILLYDGEIFEVGHSLAYCKKAAFASDRWTFVKRSN